MKYGLDGLDFLNFKFSDSVLSDKFSDKEKTALQTRELIKLENLNNESVILDIGSNHGIVINELIGLGCKIYSFEPHPLLFKSLTTKFSEKQNVVLSNTAVWNKNEKRKFYFKRSPTALNGGATLISEKTNITNKDLNVEVECVDIVDVVNSAGKEIDVFKMDIEGAEYEVLERLFTSGAYKKVKSIYFEDHSRKVTTKKWHNLKEKVLLMYKNENIELNWW